MRRWSSLYVGPGACRAPRIPSSQRELDIGQFLFGFDVILDGLERFR
jgi:hypothetical protein